MPRNPRKQYVVGEPKCYLLMAQVLDTEALDAFLKDEGFPDWESAARTDPELGVEVAGRLCYLSFGGGREHPEYIDNLRRERHGSVLEHAVATFILTGVSRTFTHECIRHRAGWSYSQLSQRYVAEGLAPMVCPAALLDCKDDPDWAHLHREWLHSVEHCRAAYGILAEGLEAKLGGFAPSRKALTAIRKVVNGAARSVLPGATETKICCTVNARAFRHFLEMRASRAADDEIRAVAMRLYRLLRPIWPELLADYAVEIDEHGREYLSTETAKV